MKRTPAKFKEAILDVLEEGRWTVPTLLETYNAESLTREGARVYALEHCVFAANFPRWLTNIAGNCPILEVRQYLIENAFVEEVQRSDDHHRPLRKPRRLRGRARPRSQVHLGYRARRSPRCASLLRIHQPLSALARSLREHRRQRSRPRQGDDQAGRRARPHVAQDLGEAEARRKGARALGCRRRGGFVRRRSRRRAARHLAKHADTRRSRTPACRRSTIARWSTGCGRTRSACGLRASGLKPPYARRPH